MPLPATVRRHFLPWNRPLPAQAAAWLARDWQGRGALDLGHLMVIVPTRQSGRRLREALAEHAAAGGAAVLAPRVVLPEDIIRPGDEAGEATRMEIQLAWAGVLRSADLDSFRAVFPVDPPARNFSWAARLGAQLMRLQATLGENGLRLRDVVARAGENMPEVARWMQLAEMERRCDQALAEAGLTAPQAARLAAARAHRRPVGIARVVMLATPDPAPLVVETLRQWAAELPVDVVVYGPAQEEEEFDEWGRPREEAWSRRPLTLTDFEGQVRLCADAADQAERVATLARRYASDGVLAVGVADAEVTPALEHGLRAAGRAVFNPGGRARRNDGLHTLLAALAGIVREDSFEAAQALVRCPDFLAALAHGKGGPFSPAAVLRELDELHCRHLPATVASALGHTAKRPSARRALEAVREVRAQLLAGEFPESAAAALQAIYGPRRVADGSALAESAGAWMEVLREAAAASRHFSGLTAAEWWELTLAQFGESLRFEQRAAGAVDLLGWLELLWEDAPHLVVTGMNDGRVPEAVTGDAFLPETLRVRLGLKTNEARLARDAYLLAALAESRKASGRLDLLVGKVSAAGDPLRPSRLLLACADEDLPRRVATLFRPVEAGRPGLPWRRAWRLTPRVVPPPSRISVTAFRDYLRCPFRFYLKHALGMEAVDPFKCELDALDFGTLCHAALEAMGEEATLRDSSDPVVLREFLIAQVDRRSRERYGTELTLPLVVQLESARQRLARAAEILAGQRAAGWVVVEVERKFEFVLGAVTVSGKIDRIERHAGTGAVRVIDYKTSDRGVSPMLAHVRGVRAEELAPDWARFKAGGREWVWTDLQLPLYLEAMAADFGGASAGYFNLPKAVGETGLVLWEDFDGTWREAARRCAEGVAAQVAAGVFWPPAEIATRDEDDALTGLFHHGTADSVNWRAGG